MSDVNTDGGVPGPSPPDGFHSSAPSSAGGTPLMPLEMLGKKPCPRCAKPNGPDAAFCAHCGSRLKIRSAPSRWIDGGCCLALAAAVACFVASVYGIGDENALVRSIDVREIFTYQKEFYRKALSAGRVPLWNPHTFSGWPFAANSLTQTFYPPSLLYLVLNQPTALVSDLILHLSLAAVGTYLLLRISFGLALVPAAFGGLAFACCGALVGQSFAGHIQFYDACAYVPLILLALERTATRLSSGESSRAPDASSPAENKAPTSSWLHRAGAWPWFGGCMLGMQILSGGIPFVWLTMLHFLIYRVLDVLRRAPLRPKTWLHEAAAFTLVTVVGAAIGAVQLLPGYELTRQGSRADAGFEYASKGSFPPAVFESALAPRLTLETQDTFWEYYAYIGLAPLAMAALSILAVRREPRLVALLFTAAFAVAYMLGKNTPAFAFLWQHVPGFNLFRVPARSLVMVHFVLAIAAAVGLNLVAGWFARLGKAGRMLRVAVPAALLAWLWIDVTVAARFNEPRLMVAEGDKPFLKNPQAMQLADVIRTDAKDSWFRIWFASGFRRNHAYALNARSITGYDNMYLLRYGRFVHFMADTTIDPTKPGIISDRTFSGAPSPFPFKILGEKYSTYKGRGAKRDPSEPIRRAWFATRGVRVADEQAALAYMRSNSFQPVAEALFEIPEADKLGLSASAPNAAPASAEVIVSVAESTPEELKIVVGPHPAGYLVLSEIFYPGWTAHAASGPLEILRADSILRAIELPAGQGQTQIDMSFRPLSVICGGATTVAVLLIALSAGIYFARPARSRERTPK